MRIAIAGGSGLVGRALTERARAGGHEVLRLARPQSAATGAGAGTVMWDPASGQISLPALEGVQAIVNLNGAGIADRRWTSARKQILRGSRIGSTRVLADAIAKLRRKPSVFLSASATGYYGDRGNEILTEGSAAGNGYLAELARDWEAEAIRAEEFGVRVVLLRFGVILAREGGALPRMAGAFRLGLGGKLGSGAQWMAWVALEDVVAVILRAIGDGRFQGPVNVVAPQPVTNAEFTKTLARVLRRPAIFRVPAFALRLAFGEMAGQALLASQRVLPQRLSAMGCEFRLATPEGALRAALGHAICTSEQP